MVCPRLCRRALGSARQVMGRTPFRRNSTAWVGTGTDCGLASYRPRTRARPPPRAPRSPLRQPNARAAHGGASAAGQRRTSEQARGRHTALARAHAGRVAQRRHARHGAGDVAQSGRPRDGLLGRRVHGRAASTRTHPACHARWFVVFSPSSRNSRDRNSTADHSPPPRPRDTDPATPTPRHRPAPPTRPTLDCNLVQ